MLFDLLKFTCGNSNDIDINVDTSNVLTQKEPEGEKEEERKD